MVKKKETKSVERVRGFTSLADHEAATSEGVVRISEIDGYELRRIWHKDEWWHSVVDVVGALTESKDAGGYWRNTKKRLKAEGSQAVTNCYGLKLPAPDGKMRETDCAATENVFRIIESIPSKRAEPIKQYLAMAGAERIKDTAQPSRLVDRAIDTYRSQGREDEWIDHRLQNISARNELTDEWTNREVPAEKFGELTNEMSAVAMGTQPAKHAALKGVPKSQLRDHMDKSELAITTVGETSAKAIITHRDTQTFDDTRQASIDGASVAKAARMALEKQLGRPLANKSNFIPRPDGSDTPLFAAADRKKSKKT